MNSYIRAVVLTNSIEDEFFRVKVEAEGFWTESPLVPVLNACPLKVGDTVIVDVSQGFSAPLVIGKILDKDSVTNSDGGQVLSESEGPQGWSVITTNQATIKIVNSDGITITIGKDIEINGGKLGGLINIGALVEKLNALVSTFNMHTHGVSSAPTTTVTSTGVSNFNRADLEDSKVKH